MTIEQICKLDPAISALKASIDELRDAVARMSESESFCATRSWYAVNEAGEGFKSKMIRLVGHQRVSGPPELQTSEAYDIVYQALYAAMPDCRNCECIPW